jgi:hypothetical protein
MTIHRVFSLCVCLLVSLHRPQFNALLKRFQAECEDFDRIPTQQMIGLIQMNSATLKQGLLPAPKRCLTEVQRLLPELGTCAVAVVVVGWRSR